MNEFKKITIKSIYDLLNSSFPIANQETWDQSGLRLFDLKSTPISKIINIKDKIANSVGRYIVDNKDRLDIDTNSESFNQFLESENHLFCDIAVVGNSIKFNL